MYRDACRDDATCMAMTVRVTGTAVAVRVPAWTMVSMWLVCTGDLASSGG
jgi:hypothetical protein